MSNKDINKYSEFLIFFLLGKKNQGRHENDGNEKLRLLRFLDDNLRNYGFN